MGRYSNNPKFFLRFYYNFYDNKSPTHVSEQTFVWPAVRLGFYLEERESLSMLAWPGPGKPEK
jgi:hypothetical protein